MTQFSGPGKSLFQAPAAYLFSYGSSPSPW